MTSIQTLDRLEDLPEPVPDGDFVVVDVIISSTSIIRILEEGAAYVKPFADVDAAKQFKQETEDAVLVGEDGGEFIQGFDHSPLPSELATADLDGRPVGFRSTNGTRALARIGDRDSVYIGSTINAEAVAAELADRDRESWIVGAGRYGTPTPEDTAGVELIEGRYHGLMDGGEWPEDGALDSISAAINSSETAQWLRDLGREVDLEEILAFDSTSTVPRLEDGRIISE